MKLEQAVNKMKLQRQKSDRPMTAPAVMASPITDSASTHRQRPQYNESHAIEIDRRIARSRRCIGLGPNTPELDGYKVLRTQIINRTKLKRLNTIMITSLRPGEGKTLTSINLALTFAQTYNHTVLLVDCDLRQQSVWRYLNLKTRGGLVDHLVDGVDFKDLIMWPKIDQLTIVSGGRSVHESAELLGSPRMKSLVLEMKNRYADRYILFDAPPILAGADVLTLMELVDGIIIVVETGSTSLKELVEGLKLLPREKILGFLMNKHPHGSNLYDVYYGGINRATG